MEWGVGVKSSRVEQPSPIATAVVVGTIVKIGHSLENGATKVVTHCRRSDY